MYVIQHRIRDWDKWDTLNGRYPTIKEARAAFDNLNGLLKIGCRIAEEYTVTRYKAVKDDTKKSSLPPAVQSKVESSQEYQPRRVCYIFIIACPSEICKVREVKS